MNLSVKNHLNDLCGEVCKQKMSSDVINDECMLMITKCYIWVYFNALQNDSSYMKPLNPLQNATSNM